MPIVVAVVLGGVPASATALCGAEGAVAATVSSVSRHLDIRLADGGSIRLSGIADAHLLAGDADAAHRLAARLEAHLAGRPVDIVADGRKPDRYGRTPAWLFLEGRLVQADLVREGLAVATPPFGHEACGGTIRQAETEARIHRRGIWTERRIGVFPATPEALSPHLGRFVVFEGAVVSVGNRRQRSYLDFGRQWTRDVTVEVPRKHRDAFGGTAALDALVGETVRVRGIVLERGGPMIEARHPGQIEVVGPGEPAE